MKVFKYQLPIKEEFTLLLPEGFEVIRIDGLDGHIYMWCVVNENADMVEHKFKAGKTGGELGSLDDYVYIGCGAVFVQQELMLYYFMDKSKVYRYEQAL